MLRPVLAVPQHGCALRCSQKSAWRCLGQRLKQAQKWLKDRRGRSLSFDDITHYQRIVKILSETDRIMKQIELRLD
jgi:hypothetical protein